MKSMKRVKDDNVDEPVDIDTSEYPYGLKLHLDNDSLKKLGIEKLPEVGAVMTLTAKVEVADISSSEGQDGEVHRGVGLQITEMELSSSKEKKDIGEELYGVPEDKTKEGPVTYVGAI
jgi:hypothetical protein